MDNTSGSMIGGGNGAGQAGPPADGKRSRRNKGRDRTPSAGLATSTAALPAFDAGFFNWLTERGFPSRESLEREAASELQQAAGTSLNMLVSNVPGSSSPDDAYRTIERNLGQFPSDPDSEVPRHQLWSDDTVVYYHLRRHFGETTVTMAQQRRRPGWYPLKPYGPLE